MRHYRINKVAKLNGQILKRKDILANDDQEALKRAREDKDCPICEVWHEGREVGDVV